MVEFSKLLVELATSLFAEKTRVFQALISNLGLPQILAWELFGKSADKASKLPNRQSLYRAPISLFRRLSPPDTG
jgi:hypothetical protein